MNFNGKLCEYFDSEKKGCVTIGMLLRSFLILVITTVIGIGLLYSIYQGFILIITGRVFDPVRNINELLGSGGIILMSMIVILLTFIIIIYVCTIKIAVCEYKKDNE